MNHITIDEDEINMLSTSFVALLNKCYNDNSINDEEVELWIHRAYPFKIAKGILKEARRLRKARDKK